MSKLKLYLVNDSLNLFLLVSTAENLKTEPQVKSDNTSGLIFIQTSCHSDSMPERFLGENWEIKQQTTQNYEKIIKHAKGINNFQKIYFKYL